MNTNFKFNFDKKSFLAWLIIILLINYNVFLWKKSSDNTIISWASSFETVKTGEIRKSIEVVWSAELIDEQKLTFNKVATVTDVNFKAWDSVKKWEVIARIDDSDAYDSIEEAKISLENANISLAQLYEPVDDSKIKSSENGIVSAQNSLEIANKEFANLKITQSNSIKKLQENIITLEKELENAKQEKSNSYTTKTSSKNNTITNIELDFKNYLVDIENIIEKADEILWISEDKKDLNDDYEDYLWAKNSWFKSDAELYLIQSFSLYDDIKIKVNNYKNNWDKEDMISILNDYKIIFNKLYSLTDSLYKTIDNSIESIWALSSSDISSMKSTTSSSRSTTLNRIDSINSSINSLNSLTDTDLELSNNNISIEKLELNLENEKKDLETTIEKYKIEYESKTQDIKSKEDKVEIEKLSLEELLQWPTSANITKAKNTISQAEIRLKSAYEDLEDYSLVAPFDWVIRKIDYMPWDNLKNENDMYVYIENPNLFEVSVMLDQIDIVKVEIWDLAIITFDSYITNPVKAKISNIDTTPVQNSWVVSYEVKLIVDDENFDKKILSWMTADVEIINELKENILLLKTSAINTVWDKKMVTINRNWVKENVEITTWLSSDGMTEILSWLNDWDKVIVWEFVVWWKEEADATLFWTPWNRTGWQRPPQ